MGTKQPQMRTKKRTIWYKKPPKRGHKNPKDDNITPLYPKKRQPDKYGYVCGYASLFFCDVLKFFFQLIRWRRLSFMKK